MIKAVFLDIDDTLLDFGAFARQAMREGFSRFGLPPYREEMYPVFLDVNDGLWRRIERGEMTQAQLIDVRWQTIFRRLGIDGDARAFERWFREAIRDSAIPVPGAGELIAWLSARTVLCAASNGTYAQQERRLALAGWRDRFDYLFISADIGAQKPARAFFDESLRRLNADRDTPILPREVLMVGDSLTSDMRGALDSGLTACYFDRLRAGLPAGLRVDAVVERLQDVPRVLSRMNEGA